MKFYYFIITILIVFIQTGNVLSENKIFNVNNIELEKKDNFTNDQLANLAIKKGFKELTEKILLDDYIKKLSNLSFSEIKELVSYYQVLTAKSDQTEKEFVKFNIFFDKEKLHNLFFKREISYSEILDKEIFLLPVLKKDDQIFIYNKNIFYDNWNDIFKSELIEFILPIENIEVIKNISENKDSLIDINLGKIFKEYSKKNLALVIIEETSYNEKKIFLKTQISNKNITKNIKINKRDTNIKNFNEKIISEVKKEIINIIKSENLIDVRTPSFLNSKLIIKNKNDLDILNKRLKKIDLIENIYVLEFNKKNVFLKIKYLGKLNRIIKQLENEKIILKLIGDQWNFEINK